MGRSTGIVLDEALNMNPAAPIAGIVDRSIHGNDGTFSHGAAGATGPQGDIGLTAGCEPAAS